MIERDGEMYKKPCNRCDRNSISSSETGEWICPSWGYDLTQSPTYGIKLLMPQNLENIKREKVISIYEHTVKK
jgi:ribosomal protein L37AE/L43A